MPLKILDWLIVAGAFAAMLGGVLVSKKYMRSVSDFLAAGRSGGRYLISVALGMAMLGSITVVGEFEMFYKSGFVLKWWELLMSVAILFVTVSGWIIYRFRQTRALTLAQFFEMRYSRKFRIFAGILAFVSGIINFGIFPAVGARFFIHYCGLPQSFSLFGVSCSTFVALMLGLLAITLTFVFTGGQVAVMVAEFIQGVFSNFVFVIMILYALGKVSWTQIGQALGSVPVNASLHNPFRAGRVEDFNFWYFLIGLVGFVYNTMSWQGTQAYNASAKSAHEAKMAQVLGNWRNYPRYLFMVFMPVVAYTILHHPDFQPVASSVGNSLQAIASPEIQSQMRVPLVLRYFLPSGLLGAFAALMLGAFIGCHNSYLHSWGSIFIQDVVMPFRRRPFSQKQHLRLLRLSILGVAVFIFFFSLLFRQSQHIYLFFAITGAIFVGGSGAVIIGGLYWKRGTTAAAWSALITGAAIAVSGIVLNQVYPDFPVNGQWFWLIAMAGASTVYVLVSLLGKRKAVDLDRLLHRDRHADGDEKRATPASPARGWKMLGMGREFTWGDKLIYVLSYSWIFLWTVVFAVGTFYNLAHPASDWAWLAYWKYYVIIFLAASIVVVFWFTIGGFVDLGRMFRQLKTQQRDERDDGFVPHDQP